MEGSSCIALSLAIKTFPLFPYVNIKQRRDGWTGSSKQRLGSSRIFIQQDDNLREVGLYGVASPTKFSCEIKKSTSPAMLPNYAIWGRLFNRSDLIANGKGLCNMTTPDHTPHNSLRWPFSRSAARFWYIFHRVRALVRQIIIFQLAFTIMRHGIRQKWKFQERTWRLLRD